MKKIIFYSYLKCSTCRKAAKWLEIKDLEFELIDIIKEPPFFNYLNLALDRVLHSSVRYPFDYGFIPNTLADDGAPLDAMVIMDEPTFAGCLIKARPIGVLDMYDCGAYDGKLLCVPMANPRQANIVSINQIAPNQLEDVAEFFRTSKGLDGRTVKIDGWRDFDVVENLLTNCTSSKKRNFKVLKKSTIKKVN